MDSTTLLTTDLLETTVQGNGSLSEFLECTEDVRNYVPTLVEFFNLLGTLGWIIITFASVALLIIVTLFISTLIHVLKNVHKKYKFSTVIVLTAYPALGLCMFLEILFPRANFILDSSAHLWFVFCMYQFFKLTMSYFGGESQYVKSLEGSVLPWRGIPCCFWPCVWPCLPKGPVNKKQVRILKFFILQHPFIQAVFSIIGFAIYVEEVSYGPSSLVFLSRISTFLFIGTTVSFLFALWAFIVSFKSSRLKLRKFKYCGKVVSFQLCLVCFRFQSVIFHLILMPTGVFPCLPPISPTVLGRLLLCSLVLGQLVILSVLAHHFYRLSEADQWDFTKKPNETEFLEPPEDYPKTCIFA